MNPENMGDHITARHQLLWRKKMFEEKDVPFSQSCHKQMNELGTTGMSWRSRNNFITTNFSQFKKSLSPKKTGRSAVLEDILSKKSYETAATKTMIQGFKIDADALDRSQKLIEGMAKLKQMKLITGKDLQKTTFPGIIKHEHIYNDYHTRNTNPGYSRNHMGKFFTK